MSARHDVVFLLDVDDTLLDNDAVPRDYRAHLVREAGREALLDYDLPALLGPATGRGRDAQEGRMSPTPRLLPMEGYA